MRSAVRPKRLMASRYRSSAASLVASRARERASVPRGQSVPLAREVELASGRLDDLFPFRYERCGSREIARPGDHDGERVERGGQLDERAGVTGETDLAGGQEPPGLAIPENDGGVGGEPGPAHP